MLIRLLTPEIFGQISVDLSVLNKKARNNLMMALIASLLTNYCTEIASVSCHYTMTIN
ncbi:hypothetical protein H1P_550003 [Hyella patelloides LEGE 07179]|uniref:Uncharacterized protein n=1 Tax=Hyella patelloides LEGE 07179 TaxID=945734 RepID=A0A563W055_9CYAN|nr:hypothetical protein [Hyella patelloides]VEP17092.1 hypothetical protein H1P_550003 [Hyella patelloides LEGE 07179]